MNISIWWNLKDYNLPLGSSRGDCRKTGYRLDWMLAIWVEYEVIMYVLLYTWFYFSLLKQSAMKSRDVILYLFQHAPPNKFPMFEWYHAILQHRGFPIGTVSSLLAPKKLEIVQIIVIQRQRYEDSTHHCWKLLQYINQLMTMRPWSHSQNILKFSQKLGSYIPKPKFTLVANIIIATIHRILIYDFFYVAAFAVIRVHNQHLRMNNRGMSQKTIQ